MSMLTSALSRPLDRPVYTLTGLFITWKLLLFLIAVSSPGAGYDTSTSLIQPRDAAVGTSGVLSLLRVLSLKLTRWDAIYYTRIANRGYIHEQEWAFGWGFTHIIGFFAAGKYQINKRLEEIRMY